MARKPPRGGDSVKAQADRSSKTAKLPTASVPVWRRNAGAWLLLLFPVIAFALYSQTISGPFVFDDAPNIAANFKMRIYELSWQALKDAATSEPSTKRYLPNLSFAINYYLNGLNVEGYHIINILTHVITSVLLFFFVRLTLATPCVNDKSRAAQWAPIVASLLFLVHPLATNVASYIVQRMASMAALFYLASFNCYIAARLHENRKKQVMFFALALLFFACSLASKQNTATLPVLVALYEWFFFQDLSKRWLMKLAPVLGLAVALLVLVGLYYTKFDPFRLISFPYEFREFTLTQRLLTQFRVVVLYISLLLFPLPSRMNLDWDFPKSLGLFSPPSTIISIAIVVFILAWAVMAARKQRLYSFCVFWFFGNLIIESSFLPLEMVFEHRTYLPSMLFFLAVALLVVRGVKPASLAATVVAVVCVLLSLATFERNKVWADDEALWRDAVKKSPNKARPHYNLCSALNSHRKPEEAIGYCQRGIELASHESYGYFNMALALEDPRIKRYDEALAYYKKTVELDPEHALALANIAHLLVVKGRRAQKANDSKTALGFYNQALSYIQSSVAIEPDNPSIWLNAGRSLYMMGNAKASLLYFQKSLQIDPGFAKAHNNIGIAYSDLGDLGQAAKHLQKSLALFPDDSVTMFNLGLILEKMGQPAQAMKYYRQTAQSTPKESEQVEAVEAAQNAILRLTSPQ